jgi:predicted amidophosphoribosyltransferase
MPKAPAWLQRISHTFRKFKAGDLSHLEVLALSLAKRIMKLTRQPKNVGVLLSVPLSEQKQRNGEVDRVRELAKRVSALLGIPYSRSLTLKGGVSRRLFKLRRLPDSRFRECYQRNLSIRHTRHLMNCIDSGRAVLVIDDVYTDGVTTETVMESLKCEFGGRVRVSAATLGIMAKTKNMNQDLSAAWRSGGGPSCETGIVASG